MDKLERKKLRVTLEVESYIAEPYTADMADLVDIQKQSGMNRARSTDKREDALRRYLEKNGKTFADYQALEKRAKTAWYKNPSGKIIIPRHHLSGCLVQACKSAPAGARFDADNLRSLIQISDFETVKSEKDTIFSRFVLPTDGKGNPLSNQRRFQKSEVIQNFKAVGELSFDATDVKEKALLDLLSYAGKYIGVGASRKMAYGRFSVGATETI